MTATLSKAKAKVAAPQAEPVSDDGLRKWALSGVAIMAVLSAVLNGHANALQATMPAAAWAMGITIPVVILILAKVAALLWQRGQGAFAYGTASAGLGLLLLSVWHCSTSISLLTGGGLWLALPQAVAIDVGFVCCEVAALVPLPRR